MGVGKKVVVIGAGAAGFMAAITAAKCGAKVTILEHMNNTGRKIELTGNGKCNLTNRNMDISNYNSDNPDMVKAILDEFSEKAAIEFFENLGIVVTDKNGYCYPMSGQASCVSSVLRMEAEHLKIKIACNINISKIEKKEVFKIVTDGYTYEADAVIIATGSKCYSSTGSDGSGYAFARSFGHIVNGPYPALVKLLSRDKNISALSGLRVRGKAKLLIDGELTGSETGEIQFIKNGISGIPVFQLSRSASIVLNGDNNENVKHDVKLSIDFLPDLSRDELYEFMLDRKSKNSYKNLAGFLTGIFNEKLISVFCSKMKIKGNVKVYDLSEEEIRKLCNHIKNTEFIIYATGDFGEAQVCCGGVSLNSLTDNLESKKVTNLFFAGEILDVDGKCGGYNLQWAWSSGYVAGYSAGR